jgi:putative component of toxin-antitoxin plasmid stabilization module
MLWLLCYPCLVLAAYPGKLDAYALLLVSQKPADVKVGAQSLSDEQVKDPGLADLAAERFCIYVNRDANMDAENNVDAVSWLAEALGASGDGKYRALLEQALQKTQDSKNKKHIGKALAALGSATVGDYTPACTGLDELRSKVLQGRVGARVSHDQLSAIKEHTSLDAVYQALGIPSAAAQYNYETSRPFIGGITLDNLELFYGESGSLRFDYSTDHWEVYKVLAAVAVEDVDANSPNLDLIHRVLSADPEVYRQAADDMIEQKRFPADVLDAAARRVWLERGSTDDDAVDALSWLCKLLGASGNVRYRTLLTALVDQASGKELRKYAKKSLDMLPPGEADQLPLPVEH